MSPGGAPDSRGITPAGRQVGAAGELTVRADTGFWSYELLDCLDLLKVRWSITLPQHPHVKAAIAGIDEDDWTPIANPDGGETAVAEATLVAGTRAPNEEPQHGYEGSVITHDHPPIALVWDSSVGVVELPDCRPGARPVRVDRVAVFFPALPVRRDWRGLSFPMGWGR